ncbi:MAG TPA: hypothetical protein VHH11_19460 [Gammaproteobacteria bacterium]|nr:hypothetical protein [Gammaproteobacteria bacterium]
MKKKHVGFMALGTAAGAYAIYVAFALHGSLAALRGTVAAAGSAADALLPQTPPAAPATAATPAQSARPAVHAQVARPGPQTGVTRLPPPAAPGVEAAAEDATLLKQRALLDVAAQPGLAELLNAPDPEVRKAALAFFE